MDNCQIQQNNKINSKVIAQLTTCFSQYLNSMFDDLSLAIDKKLNEQQKKIQKNHQAIAAISQTILAKSMSSSTSLGETQMVEQCNSSRVKALSCCHLMGNIDIQQINSALTKIEMDVSCLERSLNELKVRKDVEDPQISQKSSRVLKFKQKQQTETTITNKIEKLSSKITRLAKEGSIDEIQKITEHRTRQNMPKSKSLVSISSRKYHPVSCPKRYEYGSSLVLKKKTGHSKLVMNGQEDCLKQGFNSEVMLRKDHVNINDENKMPLINRANNVLNQLLLSCKDSGDANVVKFHLKKTFKKVEEMFANEKKKQNDVFTELHDQNNHPSNQRVPEYFSNNKSAVNLQFQNNNVEQAQKYQSSISNLSTLPSTFLSWVKQNSSAKSRITDKNETNSQLDCQSQQSSGGLGKDSRQKRKYFQRTSNDQKIMMLKKMLKPNVVKI